MIRELTMKRQKEGKLNEVLGKMLIKGNILSILKVEHYCELKNVVKLYGKKRLFIRI